MKRFSAFVTVAVLAVLGSSLALAGNDPFIATWKFNAAKSKYSLGPAPRTLTLTYATQGNGLKESAAGTAADGSSTAWTFAATYDGKDSPISGSGAPSGADTVSLRRLDAYTLGATWSKAGKVVRTSRSVTSKDGKVLTVTAKGTNAKAESDVIVFDKQ